MYKVSGINKHSLINTKEVRLKISLVSLSRSYEAILIYSTLKPASDGRIIQDGHTDSLHTGRITAKVISNQFKRGQ